MTYVKARLGESVESLLKRFKNAVNDSGILSELKKRAYYEKPSVKRKRRRAAAKKRELKRKRNFKTKPNMGHWKWNKDKTVKIPMVSYNKYKRK